VGGGGWPEAWEKRTKSGAEERKVGMGSEWNIRGVDSAVGKRCGCVTPTRGAR